MSTKRWLAEATDRHLPGLPLIWHPYPTGPWPATRQRSATSDGETHSIEKMKNPPTPNPALTLSKSHLPLARSGKPRILHWYKTEGFCRKDRNLTHTQDTPTHTSIQDRVWVPWGKGQEVCLRFSTCSEWEVGVVTGDESKKLKKLHSWSSGTQLPKTEAREREQRIHKTCTKHQ